MQNSGISLDTNDTRISSTEESSLIISIQELAKEYKIAKQKIHVLNNISIDIRQGEFVALIGASGSGKSTLLQLMGGLDKPTSGIIEINNTRLDKMNDRKLSQFRNQTIGFIFQSFYLQPFLTLRRNIEVAAMPNRMKRHERTKWIDQLAADVGLSDRLNHRPRELSGGQIQRAAIARALVNRPSIILADEPTGNLDSGNSRDITTLFQHIRQEYGTTIVIATHDQDIASQADRVIAIKDGTII